MISTRNPTAVLAEKGMVIGDARLTRGTGGSFTHRSPSTGEAQADVPLAGAVEIDDAVAAARTAQRSWRGVPADQRAAALHRLADALSAATAELAVLQAHEVGTPLRGGHGAVYMASMWARYYAGWADKLDGDVVRAFPVPGLAYTVPEPYGVIGVIVPWNSPLVALSMKVIPALAAGNAVIVKPPELAPFTSLRFAELALEAGLPPGAVNVLPGGPDAGDALVRHPGVDKITFTGGVATASKVMKAAAASVKPVMFELGGKSANLVFADADLDRAVAMAVEMSLVTLSGQGCVLPTRLYVHDDVYDDVSQRVAAASKAIVLGDPFSAETQMGPVVSEGACERILGVIDRASGDGAQLVAGGQRADGSLASGYYVQPTVFGDVDQGSDLARNEVFGPVLAMLRFSDDDDALEKANDNDFGLGAYLHTRDLLRTQRFAAELEAGSVYVNGFSGMAPAAPFGGVKRSGFGREGGRAGIDEFVRSKSVFVAAP